jgi:hypothetical protein
MASRYINGQKNAWQEGLRKSCLFVAIVSPSWLTDPWCQAQAQYAQHLGKPFRLVLVKGAHLPEDAFQDVRDLQVARAANPEEAAALIQQWIEAEEFSP